MLPTDVILHEICKSYHLINKIKKVYTASSS
jgi:hypothetical protein